MSWSNNRSKSRFWRMSSSTPAKSGSDVLVGASTESRSAMSFSDGISVLVTSLAAHSRARWFPTKTL